MSDTDITSLLALARDGEPAPLGAVFEALYPELLRLANLVVQFANTEVQVRALQGTVHKPPDDSGPEGHGTRFVRFTATAGVDPDALEEYDRTLRDEEMRTREIFNRCLGELGLPAEQSLREIADSAEKWRVRWEIRPLFPDHMTIPMRDPENHFVKQHSVLREMQLKRVSEASAEATVKAQVWRERATRGETTVAANEVIAKVVDTGTPGAGELANSMKAIFGLGMKDIVIDLAAGWMKHILVPRAAAVQKIEYHCLQVQRRYRSNGKVQAIGNGTGEIARARENCLLPETAK
ncbi:hypothetical protein RHOFW104T7_08775 [Rhodanobacter thiooxydans]|uniref:Uncharacterized protein n=1 Tax=Rhodanobacter thiooxydans TaxID=416169 RepID=A0A154QKS5_9GAMM|nr:hypothetical protein [Rhodanobacter thiooxydans]EIM02406.1 RNA polymerase sigma factor [Rhodanobacter thiooxydans LCS2]KZC24375.1 hypothetical protein RHOFW104T7_08775 [Rhodanobacter thiooxydans]MCW0201328.1 hypothetical protein [Rhodanobacter thiooxydans]